MNLPTSTPPTSVSPSLYQLQLQGVSCNGCVGKIRNALQAEDAEAQIDVDLQQGRAHIQSIQSLDQLTTLIEDLGYSACPVKPATTVLAVEGVKCNGCVGKVRQSLELKDANAAVEAQAEFSQLRVCSQLSEGQLIELLAELGYGARAIDTISDTSDLSVDAEQIEGSSDGRSDGKSQTKAYSDTGSQQPTAREQLDSDPASLSTDAIHLSLSGMTCAGCVKNVEEALDRVPGVSSVNVNFGSRNALVLFSADHRVQQSEEQDIADLIGSVEKAGYGATAVEDAEQAEALREKTERAEYQRHIRNTVVGLGLGVPLMLYGLLFEMSVASSAERLLWGAVGLSCLAVLLIAGGHFFTGAWKAFCAHNANMDTLIAVGTGSAWLYSMVVVLFPGSLPVEARGMYFEAAAMIIGLINLGQALELRARSRTSQAIKRLLDLKAKVARVLRDGEERDVPIDQVLQGDLIRIRPGEKLPVDGEVVEGHSLVDESMLTGEPVAVSKQPGSQLSAGTMNRSGTLLYRATRVGRETALAQIIAMVQKAQNTKPPISQLADQVASIFVPSVLLIAVVTALIWYNLGPQPQIAYMLVTACTVLIIACPCALGLATPISTMIGIGKAAEYGILIRNGDALQQASKLDTIVLDKTGTITQGKPSVVAFELFKDGGTTEHYATDPEAADVDKTDALKIALCLEKRSEHPLAEAVVEYCQTGIDSVADENKGPFQTNIEAFKAHSGLGVSAVIDGQSVLLGNARLMIEQQVDTAAATEIADSWQQQASTVVYLARGGKLQALMAIADPLKTDAVEAVQRLKAEGLRVVMLTGDNKATAAAVAATTAVDEFHAELMPEDKLAFIAQLQQQGRRTGMVGDGINDAPSLSRADVGFAIGTGTDVAIESADITLMRGSLHGVADAIALSRASLRNIKQNLWGAFLYNSLGIPVAAGLLYPFLGLLLNPVIAGAAMSLSSLTVVSNANRLRLFKITREQR